MKLTLLPRRCIYRKADRVPTKGKREAAGFLPLLALLSNETRVRVRSFLAFCPAVLQWHFVAFGRRVLSCALCDSTMGVAPQSALCVPGFDPATFQPFVGTRSALR